MKIAAKLIACGILWGVLVGITGVIPEQKRDFWGKEAALSEWEIQVPDQFDGAGRPTHYQRQAISDKVSVVTLKYMGVSMDFHVDRVNRKLVPIDPKAAATRAAHALPTPDYYRGVTEKMAVFQSADWQKNQAYPILPTRSPR